MPMAIGAVEPSTAMHGSVDNAMNALGGMDSEGFLKLLVAQLQYQSPLDPKDPGDLMTQTATLAQLDATQQLLAVQQRDLGLQQAVMAAGLIGREVDATNLDGQFVQGVVEGVRYTLEGPVLQIGTSEVLLQSVTEVRAVPEPPADESELPVDGSVPPVDDSVPPVDGSVPPADDVEDGDPLSA